MSARIVFQCDTCVAEHVKAQEISDASGSGWAPWPDDSAIYPGFEAVDETWGQMLAAVRGAGWVLDMNGAVVSTCVCPRHWKLRHVETLA